MNYVKVCCTIILLYNYFVFYSLSQEMKVKIRVHYQAQDPNLYLSLGQNRFPRCHFQYLSSLNNNNLPKTN